MASDTIRATHLARILAERAAAANAATDPVRVLHLQLAALHWQRVQALDARSDGEVRSHPAAPIRSVPVARG